MKPEGSGEQRRIVFDWIDERSAKLRQRGLFFVDQEMIDYDEAGGFYRDVYSLIIAGWPKEKPMWVVHNTPGGHVYHGLAIHDTICALNAAGYTINTFGMGHVASMGTAIIGAGKRRCAAPSTQFLIHEVGESHLFLEEKASESIDRSAELQRVNGVVLRTIAARTEIDLRKLQRLCKKKDYWFGAKDALKLGKRGLIDEISSTLPFMDSLTGA